MLVHKFYLIAWLELDSNLFEFNRFEFEFGKEKKKRRNSLFPLGRFLSPRPALPSPQSPARAACPPPLFPGPKARVRQTFPFFPSLLG
jgi:hypothetical protein